jgi:DNA topoisomerase IB
MARLRRSSCAAPGFTRRRHGRGFAFFDARGRRVRDADVLARVRALAIPPAWADVWICADPLGHLQAVGTDARGRRQYLYHPRWRERRDVQKFERMRAFAALLPKVRHQCGESLALDGIPPERVLACAVSLIDLGLFRIGSPAYARDNGTFGLCTIERRHVSVQGGVARFDFTAKLGKRRIVDVAEPSVVEAVADLKRRRGGGPRLLVARVGRTWREQRPRDVNSFIKAAAGPEFSAKDFRTWNATVLAALVLGASQPEDGGPITAKATRGAVRAAMEDVATSLGNTPAIARRSYVDPRVIDRFREGRTLRPLLAGLGGDPELTDDAVRATVEEAVLDLIADD